MARKTTFRWYTNKTRKHLTVKAKKYLSEQIKEYWEKKKRKLPPPVPNIYLVRVWAKVKDYGKTGHKIFIEAFAQETVKGKSNVSKKEEELKELLANKLGDAFGYKLLAKLTLSSERLDEPIVLITQPITIKIMYKYDEGRTWKTL